MTGAPHDHPAADRSVRIAWAADAAPITALQMAVWRATYPDTLAERLAAISTTEIAEQWHTAITRPSDARQRVLVALERAALRGFTTTAPSPDSDADPAEDAALGDLVVSLEARGQGHGSRLLHAAVDTMRSDGFGRATAWVGADDDVLRGFLEAQGWSPDGAHRSLDLEGDGRIVVKQLRLHTALAD